MTLTDYLDTQFQLRPCKCESHNVEYRRIQTARKTEWTVRCMDCGNRTPNYKCQHDAQIDWNTRFSI